MHSEHERDLRLFGVAAMGALIVALGVFAGRASASHPAVRRVELDQESS